MTPLERMIVGLALLGIGAAVVVALLAGRL